MASDKNAMLGSFQRVFDIDAAKSDTVALPQIALAIWVGVGGNVKLVTVDGDTVTMAAPTGSKIPLVCKQVWATGTTATGLFGLYNTAQ